MADAAGTFVETVVLPGLTGLVVLVVLLSSIFAWLGRKARTIL